MNTETAGHGETLWPMTRALAEAKRLHDRVFDHLAELIDEESDLDVLSLDSVRQMELVAEVLHRMRNELAAIAPGQDFGAVQRIHDIVHRVVAADAGAEPEFTP
ncbi:hypothetical protein [Amycolatopsis sp. WQ 127309]|uniref:hypothetical protein n=1 Tax=Amycolatopsis sp. WQ 127309 TaxID=2932773 RepID=UPI001FF48E84|nr:hypothetical protein [Amycolatopsis sp. WQ 127309]UOZ07003.1 hypothetical protein MUY22_01530 [Amycolatopsis sp. WQ 127309]